MKKTLLLTLFTLALVQSTFADKQEDMQAVMKSNEAFYDALNTMFTGDAAPIKAVWSHADDVVYMGPDGTYVVGWDIISKEWDMQAAKKLGGEIKFADAQVFLGNSLAVVHDYEIGENFDNEGKKVEVKIRATNVYRKENGEWKMVSHHVDLLPHLMNLK